MADLGGGGAYPLPPFGRKILPKKVIMVIFRAATPLFRTEWWTKVVMRGCTPPFQKILDPPMGIYSIRGILSIAEAECIMCYTSDRDVHVGDPHPDESHVLNYLWPIAGKLAKNPQKWNHTKMLLKYLNFHPSDDPISFCLFPTGTMLRLSSNISFSKYHRLNFYR